MGVIKFDPMSQPKKIRGREEMQELPDSNKLIIDAFDNERNRDKIEEKTKE